MYNLLLMIKPTYSKGFGLKNPSMSANFFQPRRQILPSRMWLTITPTEAPLNAL